MSQREDKRRKAFRAAFPLTLPILAGFWFLGMAYGLYMNASGFSVWYPALISLLVYGGSLQFVMVALLLGPFAPLETFLLALLIQIRHLFYGLSMLDKYRGLGWKRPYLIFALCDETFSVACAAPVPEEVDPGWFYFWVSLLNHLYWLGGSIAGGLAGSFIQLKIQGLDFVLTALFAVIFLDQWTSKKLHFSALIGLLVSLGALWAFGPDAFLLPAMALILGLLLLGRKPLEKRGAPS